MNCLEWLPIYFGILKIGALAVPLNFRYTSAEIDYCVNLADVNVLVFGPEFIGRVEIAEKYQKQTFYFMSVKAAHHLQKVIMPLLLTVHPQIQI